MEIVTKEYLENNIKAYDSYRGLGNKGKANGIATLDANGKLVSAQIPSGVGAATYQGNLVTSIVAGSNTAMSISNGALTIASTAAGNGNVPAYTSADANKMLVVNNSGTEIKWAPSPFYEEDTNDNDKFTFAIEQYKVAYIMGQPTFAFTGDIGGEAFNSSLAAYNTREDIQQAGMVIEPENIEQITAKDYIGFSITCPSDVVFAQLDLPVSLPQMPTVPLMTTIQSKKVSGKQVLSIQESNPAAGFTPAKTSYAYLRFTRSLSKDSLGNIIVAARTYNATIAISYKSRTQSYSVSKVF